jgi:hypothetical protein
LTVEKLTIARTHTIETATPTGCINNCKFPIWTSDNWKLYNRKNTSITIVKYAYLITFMKTFVIECFLFIPERDKQELEEKTLPKLRYELVPSTYVVLHYFVKCYIFTLYSSNECFVLSGDFYLNHNLYIIYMLISASYSTMNSKVLLIITGWKCKRCCLGNRLGWSSSPISALCILHHRGSQ